ncbi:MAG: hypothetical protein ABI418_00970 [Jatrophihabitantaceae bacterium]
MSALTLTAVAALPGTASAVTAPNATAVYYVGDLNSSYYFNLGCAQGQIDFNRAGTQTRVVVLQFGDPAMSGTTYGTLNLSYGEFDSRSVMLPLALEFAHGYWQCTSSDTASSITLAVTSSNYGNQVVANPTQQGRAWSNFVTQVRSSVDTAGYGNQVNVQGGYDMEPGFNSGDPSLALLDGYYSINSNWSYDTGSADGCPQSGLADCSANGHTWTVNQRYLSAWGDYRSLALPQVYQTNGAQAGQWANLSRYGANHLQSPIAFSGIATQQGACSFRPCAGTNNSPAQGYQQLYAALQLQPNTAMAPQFSEDFRWEGDVCPC